MTPREIEELMLVMDEARRIDERGNLEEIFREDDDETRDETGHSSRTTDVRVNPSSHQD